MVKYCIIGGGPAGLVLANELRKYTDPSEIVILEAGGVEEENIEDAHFVSVGETDYQPIRSFRLGGHGHLWGGACPRLNPADFEMYSRFEVFQDWPIKYSDLLPFYEKAEKILEVENHIKRIPDDYVQDPIAASLDKNGLIGSLPYGNRGYFVENLIPDVMASKLSVYTDCVVRRIEDKENYSIVYFNNTKSGQSDKIISEVVILCAGGLSNARILQLSKSKKHPNGMGNHSSKLGKGHMDHPRILVTIKKGPTRFTNNLHEEGTLPVTMTKAADSDMPFLALASITIARKHIVDVQPAHIVDLITRSENLQRDIASSLQVSDLVTFDFEIMDPPHDENRLELSSMTDKFGDPILATNINIDAARSEIDNMLLNVVGSTFSDYGYAVSGMVKFGWTGQHPSGSTRMAIEAEDGVVDANLKVFGTGSVYVLGSSVFPTCGYANPTLTIVGLALRLADHLINLEK